MSSMFGLVGAYWIGRGLMVDGRLRLGNPVGAEPLDHAQPSFDPLPSLRVRAEVTRVVEGRIARVGDKCEFLVEQHLRSDRSYQCHAQVVCGGSVLYGGPESGFFPCVFSEGAQRDVAGHDPNTTREDHDAAFEIDTRTGVLRVWDDATGELGAFSLEGEVLSAR